MIYFSDRRHASCKTRAKCFQVLYAYGRSGTRFQFRRLHSASEVHRGWRTSGSKQRPPELMRLYQSLALNCPGLISCSSNYRLRTKGKHMKSMLLSLLALFISTNAWAQPPLDAFMSGYAKEHNFNGTILVQKNDKVIYSSSFGLANFRFDVPNTVQTKYRIASITKVFTSVLVLQL